MKLLLLALALQVQAPAQSASPDVSKLANPELVHQRERTTDRDDEALVQALEHRLKCTCGCGLDIYVCRTTDFTCTTSPAMHRVVLARLDSNMTADQVVAAFEAQYGTSILMQPPKRGFNWTAYFMPFVALAAGLTGLLWAMTRWVGNRQSAIGNREEADSRLPTPDSRSEDMKRLEAELEHFES